MFRITRRTFAVAALIVAGVALAGCGRKGGLDLPPTAANSPEATAGQPAAETADARGRALLGSAPAAGSAPAPAPRGTKKPFVLDPLLD